MPVAPWHCVLAREEFDGSRPELQLMQTCMHRGVLQRPSAALGGVPLIAQVAERRYRHAPEHRPARERLRNTGGSAITHLAGLSTHARGWASSLRGRSRYTSSALGVEVYDRGRQLMLLVLSRCTTAASEQRPDYICSRLSFSHSAALGGPSGCYTARHCLHR
jgi:hypothetical protein